MITTARVRERLVDDMAMSCIYAIGLKQLLLFLLHVVKITEYYEIRHGQPTT